MPQEEIAVGIRTYYADLLAAPPRGLKRSPICHSDKAGDFDLAVAEMHRSAPAHVVNGALELLVVLRHSANTADHRPRAGGLGLGTATSSRGSVHLPCYVTEYLQEQMAAAAAAESSSDLRTIRYQPSKINI